MTNDSINLTSITGVIAATFVVVEIIKKLVKPETPVLGKIPVILFPLVIAPILALVANKAMFRDDGTPILSGNVWTVLGRAILGAASSSGLYTWLRQPGITIGDAQPLIGSTKPGEDTTMKPNFIILLAASLVLLVGCQGAKNPEKVALREAMYQGTTQMRSNHKAWAEKLVAYPAGTTDPRTGQPSDGKNKASEITPLTPAQYRNGVAADDEFNKLVEEDRARDNEPVIGK